jgi:putative membrane protein
MLLPACVFAGLAALVHVYIFVIESLRFESPSTLRTFGIRASDAAVLKPVFYNQGFYNLFLALGTLAGIASVAAYSNDVGVALVGFGVGSMLAAATVLVTSDGSKARAALVQGLFPALTLLCLLLWAVA